MGGVHPPTIRKYLKNEGLKFVIWCIMYSHLSIESVEMFQKGDYLTTTEKQDLL